jgi:hypothetical protein
MKLEKIIDCIQEEPHVHLPNNTILLYPRPVFDEFVSAQIGAELLVTQRVQATIASLITRELVWPIASYLQRYVWYGRVG